MSARNRLNEAYLFAAVFWGAIFGAACNSWIVFVVTTGVLTVMHVVGGSIRLRRPHARPFPGRRIAMSKR